MILLQEYSEKQVSSWGGMQEMKMVLEKTGISKKIEELGLPEKKSNNSIEGISIIESFWVSVWIGCFRFSHTAVVRLDEVLRQIFGWHRVASGTTFGRFFKSFSQSRSHQFFIDFLEEKFVILKNKTVGLFRADSGFCSEQILKFIEGRNIAYVVCAKLYANLQREVYDIQKWVAIGEGIWISEILFKQGGWSK